MAWSPSSSPHPGFGPRTPYPSREAIGLATAPRRRWTTGRAVGVARGRGPAGGGAAGAVSVKTRAAAAAAGASGWCARLWGAGSAAAAARRRRGGSVYGGSGPSGAAAVRTPAAAGEAQPGLRAPRSRRGPGTGDPSRNPEPYRVGWAGARTPVRSCSRPAAAGRERRRAPDRGPGIPPLPGAREDPAPQAQKCLPSLPGARSAAEQSCRRVPIAKPRHCRDPAGPARSRSAADTPAPPPPLPRSRPPSGNCF